MRIPHPKKIGAPPPPPHYAIIGRTEGGISKSWPRVPKLLIWVLRGWGRCLKLTLRTRTPENFWGPSGGSCMNRPESEDPHRRKRKFIIFFHTEVFLVWPSGYLTITMKSIFFIFVSWFTVLSFILFIMYIFYSTLFCILLKFVIYPYLNLVFQLSYIKTIIIVTLQI
jgi:hypothetical protein